MKELQVYVAKLGEIPDQVKTLAIERFLASASKNPQSVPRYWTRNEIAHWLKRIREEVRDRVHFWPFDGWQPQDERRVAELEGWIFGTG